MRRIFQAGVLIGAVVVVRWLDRSLAETMTGLDDPYGQAAPD